MLGITKGEKWKQSGEMAFCEAIPPDGRNRPLEWRRGFNYLQIPVTSWSVNRQWSVHDTTAAISAFEKTREELYSAVSAAPATRLSLELSVYEDAMRDSIYFFEKSAEDKDLFELESAAGPTKVVIVERDVAGETAGPFSKSIQGYVFRTNYEPGQDEVLIELGMPKAQIEQLIECLSSDEKISVSLMVLLEAFTYEVDDALREHYYPQAFAIKGSSHAYLDRVNLCHGQRLLVKKNPHAEEDLGDEIPESEANEEPSDQALSPSQTLIDVGPIAVALEKMTTAIWVAVVAAVLIAAFA